MDSEQTPIDLYLDLLKKVLTASIYEESSWAVQAPSRNPIRNLLLRAVKLVNHSFELVRRKPFDKAARAEGQDYPLFGFSMTGHRRLDNVEQCVKAVLANNVPGDFIETGVWRGGTTIFMRALLKAYGVKDRTVWVADSFDGLPVPKDDHDGPDLSGQDFLAVSLPQVQENFRKFDLLDEQVRFLKGWFCDTLPNAPIEKIAVLRLDGDLYSSTMDAFNSLYPKVSPGGYVIVDDYHSWDSCKAAVTDYRRELGITAPIQKIDWTGAYWQVSAAAGANPIQENAAA